MNEPITRPGPAQAGLMADTVHPERIPDQWADAVLAYRDGEYAWPPEQIARFHRLIGISVTGDPAAARYARELDVEHYDASPADTPRFVDYRHELGHRDATVYCSRSTLPAVFRELGPRRPRLHIATLDNQPWTPAELAADILANWDLTIDPEQIWGIQAYTADLHRGIWWDTTLVYGKRDFWDPARHDPATAAALAGPDGPYLCPEPWRERPMSTLEDLAVFLRGSGDSFTGDLLRLMARSDPVNQRKLAVAYPAEADVWQLWNSIEAPTFGQLLDTVALRREVTG